MKIPGEKRERKSKSAKHFTMIKWKRINRKQCARWQHLSRLNASGFVFEKKILVLRNAATYT
jgi:hypothetical protein